MNRLRGIAFLLLLVVWPFGQARADKALEALKPFLRTHCLECHGPDKQKNEIRFDTLGTTSLTAARWRFGRMRWIN